MWWVVVDSWTVWGGVGADLDTLRHTLERNDCNKIPCSLFGVWFTALAGDYDNCIALVWLCLLSASPHDTELLRTSFSEGSEQCASSTYQCL